MPRPRKGDKITADWAGGLQVRSESPIPVGGSRTSTGPIAPANSPGSVSIIAKNGATPLLPWTLVWLDTVSPAVTDDGRLILKVTTSRSKLVVCTGPATVPANGQFVPVLFDLTPLRVKVKSGQYWAEGIPCGKDPGSSLLSSREGGLLCVKIPDASGYAWVISDFNAIWAGVIVGALPASANPINPAINGVVAVIKGGVITNQRVDLCSCSDVPIEDGIIATIGYTDRWSLLWANCSKTTAASGLTVAPSIGTGGP